LKGKAATLKTNSVLLLPLKAILIIIMVCGISSAGDNSVFVDLDGDGFNDTPPTSVEPLIRDSLAVDTLTSFFSFAADQPKAESTIPYCSSYFELRQYGSRFLSRNRCSFDADLNFGPGGAVGNISLSSAGSICSGGSCHR
jgi:hypothetical protein